MAVVVFKTTTAKADTGIGTVSADSPGDAVLAAAEDVFGERTDLAVRFVDLLQTHGVERGLIGPREVDRLWDRHVLNSAVIAELLPRHASVIDVGSGGGFPGVPLAIARPDITITLLEPMARRVDWLEEVATTLGLEGVTVVRGRAEEKAVRQDLGVADVVTARAVAPLERLAGWCLPLVRPDGLLLAIKGASADDEVARDRGAVGRLGGSNVHVVRCGGQLLEVPTTVVVATKAKPPAGRPRRR